MQTQARDPRFGSILCRGELKLPLGDAQDVLGGGVSHQTGGACLA